MTHQTAAFTRAIEVLGSSAMLAKVIDRSPQFVHHIKSGRRNLPCDLAPHIEKATRAAGSPVYCEELAPQFPWELVRGTKGPGALQ